LSAYSRVQRGSCSKVVGATAHPTQHLRVSNASIECQRVSNIRTNTGKIAAVLGFLFMNLGLAA
jgi:hypothetical protein